MISFYLVINFQISVITVDLYFKTNSFYYLYERAVDMHIKYYKEIKNRHLLNKCCARIILWSRISVIVKILTVCIIPITFQYLYTVYLAQQPESLFNLYIPGLNPLSFPGFQITAALSIIDFIFMLMELIFYEIQILGVCLNMVTMGDILISTIKELDIQSERLTNQQLNDAIELYYEYVRFIDAFKATFNVIIILKFLTSIMNISVVLFIIQIVSI